MRGIECGSGSSDHTIDKGRGSSRCVAIAKCMRSSKFVGLKMRPWKACSPALLSDSKLKSMESGEVRSIVLVAAEVLVGICGCLKYLLEKLC